MNPSKLSPRFLSGILIVIFFGVAVFIRAYFPFDEVFGSNWIKFTSHDAYFHMRVVDNLVHHFPHCSSFDPYAGFPGGALLIAVPPFFHWFMGGIAWLIGLGSPTQHTVDLVGAYLPAILGALVVVPVYFIGKELFGRWAGVVSAALIAILPGEFLGRSILGFTDHHVAEVLFTAVAMMFLVMAIKRARERQLTFSHFRQRDRVVLLKPMIYSLLAGVFLGIYLISWTGALLFVFIIAVFFIIQFIIDHWRRQSTDYLCLVGVALFLIALIIRALVLRDTSTLVSVGIALLIPIALVIISRWMTGRGIRLAYFPVVLLVLAGAGLVIFRFAAPSLWRTMWTGFEIFNPGVPITIMEMEPLLSPQGNFTFILPWKMFGFGFYISLVAIVHLIYLVVRRDGADKSILIVWSLIILAATLGQRRFAYYFAVNVALLTGYLSWLVLRFASLFTDYLSGRKEFASFEKLMGRLLETQEVEAQQVETQQVETRQIGTKKKKSRRRRRRESAVNPTTRYILMSVAVVVVFFLVFFPNITQALDIVRQPKFAPSDAWCSSLTWLRENSPEPFDDPDYYYQLHERARPPESAYAVTAWGDYGYWILRIAHRPVNDTPGPGGEMVAKFFLYQEEDSAPAMAELLDTSYVIIDHLTTTDKFYALARWAGQDKSQFYDVYYFPQEGSRLVPVILFYPEYYRSLAVRLYNFDGQEVTPEISRVIAYEVRTHPEIGPIKVISDFQVFDNYEEAVAYISEQEPESYRIANDNPFDSPVPLAAVEDYRLIHSSDEEVDISGIGVVVPEVKIFEYTGTEQD